MNFRRLLQILNLSVILLIAVLAGAYFLMRPDGSENQKEHSILIGASYMTMNNELFAIINEQIVHRAEAEGDRVVLRDPALNVDRQVEQIDDMLNMGIDVLVVTPVDAEGLNDVLKRAREQGVLIIVVDSDLADPSLADCTIVSDNHRAGVLVGEYLLSQTDHADLVILTHNEAISGVERVRGFLDTVGGHEGFRIVEEIPCEGKLELAMPRMEKKKEKGIAFDNVFCLNDPACIGAAAALGAHGLLDRVNLYGVDASPDGKALIRDGNIQASAAQFPTRVGEQAADTLYSLLNGEKVESRILVPVELVTKENVEEYNVDRWQ